MKGTTRWNSPVSSVSNRTGFVSELAIPYMVEFLEHDGCDCVDQPVSTLPPLNLELSIQPNQLEIIIESREFHY